MVASSTITTAYFDDSLKLNMLQNLSIHAWSQHSLFLPETLRAELADECRALQLSGALRAAGMGQSQTLVMQSQLRGDQIQWLEVGQSIACDHYLAIMEDLRIVLNRNLFLGLDSFESHFAFYAPGASYTAHRDRFQDDDSRVISVVIYLNQDWLPEQGGALRLHPIDADSEDVVPVGAHMVLFLSADMLHEVLPATRNRLSIAGWFRQRKVS